MNKGHMPQDNHAHQDVGTDTTVRMPSPDESYDYIFNNGDRPDIYKDPNKPDIDKINRDI